MKKKSPMHCLSSHRESPGREGGYSERVRRPIESVPFRKTSRPIEAKEVYVKGTLQQTEEFVDAADVLRVELCLKLT